MLRVISWTILLSNTCSSAFGIKPSPRDILAYLSDEISLKENDIHKEPLTKLKQDTIKQMHDGGVID